MVKIYKKVSKNDGKNFKGQIGSVNDSVNYANIHKLFHKFTQFSPSHKVLL